MEEFVAYHSRWRLILLLLGAVAFVASGLWLGALAELPVDGRYPSSFLKFIGWLSVLFFGMCAISIVRKFFDRRVQLQIGPSGIRSASWSDDLIPWSEIVDVTTWSHKGTDVMVLHLRDPERFAGRRMRALWAGLNRKLTGGDITLSLVGTTRSHQDAMEAVARFRASRSEVELP